MTRLNKSKINNLIMGLTPGVVVTSKWLKEEGVSSKLAWWYVHSGWLERIGEGAYKKAGENVTWLGGVSALQNQLKLSLHLGAKTALQLLGQTHFVPLQGIKQVVLFAKPNTRIPQWLLNDAKWEVTFSIHKTALFQKNDSKVGLVEKVFDGINILLSTPERAALEILHLIPAHQSFDEAALLMQSLSQLRPQVVQVLLEECKSIKVKRLFLYFADEFQHPWLSNLDVKKIDLGHGKRMIANGGSYSSKYQISVPKILEE